MNVFRESCWNRLRPFIDTPVVKVIMGMRRCGKSYFLRQIMLKIKAREKKPARFVYIDMEDLAFSDLKDAAALHKHVVTSFGRSRGPKYLFIDEVQEIKDWEKAIASFHKQEDIDIYLTGSNAHLLSSELATLLSGRCVQIPIYPLGFKEYLAFKAEKCTTRENDFLEYLRFGGMPALFHFESSEEIIYQYDDAIISTIVLKDIVARYGVRNVPMLERIGLYLLDNIAQTVSAGSISKFLKSQSINVFPSTVQEYLGYFASTLMLHRACRYDIRGKRLLESAEKYFVSDLGMRHARLGYRNTDVGQFLENVVFMELMRRGYQVTVGKTGDLEVDFVARRRGEVQYFQVSYLLFDKDTRDRELRSLRAIRDNYPKTVLSMDTIQVQSVDGINIRNLPEWLLEE